MRNVDSLLVSAAQAGGVGKSVEIMHCFHMHEVSAIGQWVKLAYGRLAAEKYLDTIL